MRQITGSAVSIGAVSGLVPFGRNAVRIFDCRHHFIKPRAHVVDVFGVIRILDGIVHLFRISFQVVQLVDIESIEHVFEPLGDADALRVQKFTAIVGAQDLVGPGG